MGILDSKIAPFEPGDHVTWSVNGRGGAIEIQGKVIARLTRNQVVPRELWTRLRIPKNRPERRMCEMSYIILDQKTSKVYWPETKWLKIVRRARVKKGSAPRPTPAA